jgi:8-oxo-dGTP pyrophosphatase MutT (NUDIX family)
MQDFRTEEVEEHPNQAYLEWIVECNHYDVDEFIPFVIDGSILGYVHRLNQSLFTEHCDVFTDTSIHGRKALTFLSHFDSFTKRTETANQLAQYWLETGVITSWVGEQYNVNTGYNHHSFFTIERAAASLLGIKKYGVHLNAWVKKGGEIYLWVARRSKDKPTFPGKLDHLVAGGHGAGLTIYETMIKECQEEANIPENIARTAKAVSLVTYAMERNQKLQQDNLFVYDLELSPDFVPENTDGEAEEFFLWPVEEVLKVVATSRDYKTNCNLVIIDFAVRHGYLKPDEPLYTDICSGLHQQINL